MDAAGHVSLVELERRERAERDAAKARRLRIVILAVKGYTAPAIALSLGLSRRVCQQWVYRYNESGLEGLEDRRGRTPGLPLSPEQQQQVCERIEADAQKQQEFLRELPGRLTTIAAAHPDKRLRVYFEDEDTLFIERPPNVGKSTPSNWPPSTPGPKPSSTRNS
ncbi:MAG: helix-turn-helix domain containing protein [Planctomycetaceae bacterium]